jgi:hypothetical protein
MRAGRRITGIIAFLAGCMVSISAQSIIPRHSLAAGGIVTTMNAGEGVFLDYQYHLDDQISYTFRPGITGILQGGDSLNVFIHIGMNYRLNTLRRPLKDRFLNTQPYAGFYPASIEYVLINSVNPDTDGSRLGWSPMGTLGYTLIFANLVSLDLHAGFGMSFRLGWSAGKDLTDSSIIHEGLAPTAEAGISIGIRL